MTDNHAKGFLLTTLGVLFLTPDTLLIRLVEIDQWTMIFWRGVLMAVGLTAFIVFTEKGQALGSFIRVGWIGVGVGLAFCFSSISFVVAIDHTTVANTLVIIASTPMIAVVLSRLFLKERVVARTLFAVVATFAGVAFVLAEDLSHGGLIGNAAALLTALFMAGNFVLVRIGRETNMVPAMAIGAVVAVVIVAAPGWAVPMSVPRDQIWLLILMGLILLPLSFGLITIGPRLIPAPEVGLLLLLETVLGPLWVWLVIGERVSETTLIGGAIVVLTLALNSFLALKSPVVRN